MKEQNLPTEFPKTVIESVEWLESILAADDLKKLAALKEDDLINLHFGLGTYIRNSLQVWSNEPLKMDAGVTHEDDVSMVIIKKLWQKLRNNPI